MNNPRCIRIFRDRKTAESAKVVLHKGGFQAYVKEDVFGTLTLEELDMPSRFRLYIDKGDIEKAGIYLAQKLNKKVK